MRPLAPAVTTLLVLAACGGSSASNTSETDDAAAQTVDAQATDAPNGLDGGSESASPSPADAGGDVDKAASCAPAFGNALTDAFGRLDGTVVAIVPPGDEACAMPNKTHLVIQVSVGGAVYRMVVDVLSSFGSPDVLEGELDAPLAPQGTAWAEGWHAGVALDYVTTLNVHDTAFTAMHEADLVKKITSEIDLGAHISVFATSQNEPSSAHLVHRNATNADGAIVVRPDSGAPHYILLRFAEQTF